MPKQNREKIGEMPCKVCASVIDVKAQKNGVPYAHCGSCGVRHTGGLHSPEPLGGLEHHGAKCIHLEQTTVNIENSTINGTANGNATVEINQTPEKTGKDNAWYDEL